MAIKIEYGRYYWGNSSVFTINVMPGCCGVDILYDINHKLEVESFEEAFNLIEKNYPSKPIQYHIPVDSYRDKDEDWVKTLTTNYGRFNQVAEKFGFKPIGPQWNNPNSNFVLQTFMREGS